MKIETKVTSRFEKFENRKLLMISGVGALIFLLIVYWLSTGQQTPLAPPHESASRTGVDKLHMAGSQLQELDVGEVPTHSFVQRRDAIGIIDFNQDSVVQVFSPYQGRIGQIFVKAGDDVEAGHVLYTVQIPDLAQAGSTLVSSLGALKVANETLARAKSLFESQSISLKEYQQNVADQQSADAAYRAARKTMALFGLSDTAISEIEKSRKIETEMPVLSPFAGRVTVRAGAIGQLVQPGNAPAPITVANIKRLWMVASVPESELAAYRLGQEVSVRVPAFPEKAFSAKISYVADSVDPNTHRIGVRADVADPEHLLRPQMLANFSITIGAPIQAPALPQNALVRESDGSMSVWVAADDGEFVRRSVKTGLTQDNFVQITDGLKVGERVAKNKALFLSNLYLTSTN